jgi:NAD(P)-dependent dehydrogenase (short-subunit alcohol dehydrogenase family)
MGPTEFSLEGKVAFVTGAGSGIGRAVALRFLEHGASVLGTGLLPSELDETGRLAGDNRNFVTVPADLGDSVQVEHAVSVVMERFGQLDILFNGAGGSGRQYGDGPVHACSEDGWDWVMTNNLKSMFLCCKYGVQAILAGASGGSVINLGSVLGLTGNRLFATHAYAASKAAVVGLTRAMAAYYADRGIRCNVIAPGLIQTAMSRRAATDPEVLDELPRLQPLTASMGDPDDVAAAALYLGSTASRFVTGIVLPVDAGWTAQ